MRMMVIRPMIFLLLGGCCATLWAQEGTEKLKTSSDEAQGMFDRGFSSRNSVADSSKVYEVTELDSVPSHPEQVFSMDQCPMSVPDSMCIPNTTVYVSFVVERNGSCSAVKVQRPNCPQFDDPAVCMVQHWGLWKPGYRKGLPVRTHMVIPVVCDPPFR